MDDSPSPTGFTTTDPDVPESTSSGPPEDGSTTGDFPDDTSPSSTDGSSSESGVPDEEAVCGDGIVADVESCDDGDSIDNDGCDADCEHSEVVQIAGGFAHLCALTRTGDVFCWGANDRAQLGQGHDQDVSLPDGESLPSPVLLGSPARQISVGGNQSCAVLEDDTVRCWGDVYGDEHVGDQPGEMPPPTVAIGDMVPVEVAVAWGHACVLLSDATVRCWGSNELGALPGADSDVAGTSEDVAALVTEGMLFDEHAVVADHIECHQAGCCLAAGAETTCWGYAGNGSLGRGPAGMFDVETPGPVLGELAPPASVHIAGERSVCRITATGEARCWGANGSGQLGTGDNETVWGDFADPPVDVPFGADTVGIAVGLEHLCSLSNTGEVRCLGSGARGQNGAGTSAEVGTAGSDFPLAPLPLPAAATTIGGGRDSTCVWLEAHELRCWGANDRGQLGQGHLLDLGDNELLTSGSPTPLFDR